MNRSFIVSLVLGVVFALGLGFSGMTDANKVIGFLNLAGDWDIALMLVMGGALMVTIPAYQFYKSHRRPVLGGNCTVPEGGSVDRKLLIGAGLFGLGWGLGGYCPGPGLVSAVSGGSSALVFTGSMLAGMFLYARASAGAPKKAEQSIVDDECVRMPESNPSA